YLVSISTVFPYTTLFRSQHGFSRHSEYRANQLSDTEVVFTLEPNEEILKQYPYLFKLEVTYSLNDNVLACNLKVTNTDNKEIYRSEEHTSELQSRFDLVC